MNLSFLDVITCGFGAIILLLMIARPGDPPILETSDISLQGVVRDLQTQLFEIRGETSILNRDLNAKHEQISVWDEKIARLQSELKYTKTRYEDLTQDSSVNAIITGELALALQSMTAEMQRLLAQKNDINTSLVGGIPVDSEYIIFIIDTSGSMVNANWDKMINQLVATLDVYPKVKGIQIMSDMGAYMVSQYRKKWIPDTRGRRNAMIRQLRSWNTFSNSSPVEGITRAIRDFYDPKKKISIYVMGDEFTGRSVKEVVNVVDRLNPKDASGKTRVRIHGVGFPVPITAPEHFQITRKRFATLMRELTQKNGGTFVALN
ncbi:MAG: VWA domain-containing protein [Gammaproteobacteria bacterium]|nr:VWA domain-containing protein [Gammaproteobacteria bacterium]